MRLLRGADCQARLTLIKRPAQRRSDALERRNLRVNLGQPFGDQQKEREFIFC